MLRDSFTDVRAPSSSIREGERGGGEDGVCVVVVVGWGGVYMCVLQEISVSASGLHLAVSASASCTLRELSNKPSTP